MKLLIYIGGLILLSFKIHAQSAPSSIKRDSAKVICICCGPTDPTKMPSYVINGKVVDPAYFQLIDAKKIAEVTVLRESEAGIYREWAKNGVIVVQMMENVEWVKIDKILKREKIRRKDRNLPIFFKGTKLTADELLVDKNKLITINILDSAQNQTITAKVIGRYLSISETNN